MAKNTPNLDLTPWVWCLGCGVTPWGCLTSYALLGASLMPEGNIITNDIIIALENKPIDSVAKLLARIDSYKIGDTISITVLRKNQQIEMPVTLQPGD